eukprot:TRINITY_DN739_c0_g4_i1.p2 TRINITY_DN739_c0_g4~~TRINITY_DN739_c0_g4_i1.p2  ORF type:complete len:141 (+),score=22.42 TRINITY_DN739_c0_g4_i1:258-680(+)
MPNFLLSAEEGGLAAPSPRSTASSDEVGNHGVNEDKLRIIGQNDLVIQLGTKGLTLENFVEKKGANPCDEANPAATASRTTRTPTRQCKPHLNPKPEPPPAFILSGDEDVPLLFDIVSFIVKTFLGLWRMMVAEKLLLQI